MCSVVKLECILFLLALMISRTSSQTQDYKPTKVLVGEKNSCLTHLWDFYLGNKIAGKDGIYSCEHADL